MPELEPHVKAGKHHFPNLCSIFATVKTALFLGNFIKIIISVRCFLWWLLNMSSKWDLESPGVC